MENLEIIQINTIDGKLVATLSYQSLAGVCDQNNGFKIIDVPVNIRALQLSARANVLVNQSVKRVCVSDDNESYSKRVFLNKLNSASTGSVVTFDGIVQYKNERVRSTFLSISDCYVSARLHKADEDTADDFIDKMKLLKNEIELFINHLEKSNNECTK